MSKKPRIVTKHIIRVFYIYKTEHTNDMPYMQSGLMPVHRCNSRPKVNASGRKFQNRIGILIQSLCRPSINIHAANVLNTNN